MGAGQSASRDAPAQEVKTSYYELLGVQRQATEEELKKAYRRKALELHPDRNYGNEEHATKVFAEVQAAYEVLSDPQERAWYDSHESAILHGEDPEGDGAVPSYDNVRITTADDLARVVGKFNKNVEFTDAPSGFFGFLRELFEQLATEETAAAMYEGTVAHEYPTFGHKDDEYGDVVRKFYATWSSFSTVKSFSWKDHYRLSEAPDRWYRRRMEQENKKYRQDGIREFNDAVRSLVAFIRKRDPRYVPSTQTEEERQKILRDAAAAQATRARAANAAKTQEEVPEWTKSREPDPLAEHEGGFDSDTEEEEVFQCVACNKLFKSEKQWQAHEKSKKHQKAIKELQKKMKRDNANLDLEGTGSGIATPDVEDDDDDDGGFPKVPTLSEELEEESKQDDLSSHGEEHVPTADLDIEELTENSERTDLNERHDQQDEACLQRKVDNCSEDDDSDYASPDAIAARLQDTKITDTAATPAIGLSENDINFQPALDKKMGAAAKKRAKKAAAAASGSQPNASHACAGCEKAFQSKTRLFQHLKDFPTHAQLKGFDSGGGKKLKKGKR
ncbi:DnaJ-domain-containing protein [Teratosphaeria destructans]|uniref:DnaJ-domain-containing protein n=1 Tax=Teratosphaeria destructans TaxID=418781 RepID=A0A9W7SQB6_9PEZI|nr:DnaJ-domain-containing protein [Teratosphaeria destructans]